MMKEYNVSIGLRTSSFYAWKYGKHHKKIWNPGSGVQGPSWNELWTNNDIPHLYVPEKGF